MNIDHADWNRRDVRNARFRSRSSCERCISPRIPLIVSEERTKEFVGRERSEDVTLRIQVVNSHDRILNLRHFTRVIRLEQLNENTDHTLKCVC